MIHVLVPTLIGLVGSILAWRGSAEAADRKNWATVIVALAGAAALSLFVFRSMSTAPLFALPGCAWLGLRAWPWARTPASTVPRIPARAIAALPDRTSGVQGTGGSGRLNDGGSRYI